MRRIRNLIVFIVICTLVGISLEASSYRFKSSYKMEEQGLNERITNDLSVINQSSYIDKEVQYFLQKWDLRGVSIALLRDDQLVYAQGFGIADEDGRSVEPGSSFRVASVSKLITATGVMKLVEKGKLSLDDYVFGPKGILNDSIFNDVRDRRLYQITVREILAHTAGWSQRAGDPAFNSLKVAEMVGDKAPATMSSYYKFVSSTRLSYYPGTRYAYSNMGYMFLADIISKVSGEPYENFIQENILKPNGIYGMYIGNSFQKYRRRNEVSYFEGVDHIQVPCMDGTGEIVNKSDGGNPIELLGAAGGWVCSSVELAKFISLIDGDNTVPDILSTKSIQLMTSQESLAGPLGWRTVYANGDWIRTGSMAGTIAMIKRMQNGYTWVFLSNSSNWKGNKLERNINYLMTKIMRRVKDWPKYDLFQYYKTEEVSISYLGEEMLNSTT